MRKNYKERDLSSDNEFAKHGETLRLTRAKRSGKKGVEVNTTKYIPRYTQLDLFMDNLIFNKEEFSCFTINDVINLSSNHFNF